MTSYNFGPIEVNPLKRDMYFIFEEISFGLSQMLIRDSTVSRMNRQTEFVNILKTREGTDVLENY